MAAAERQASSVRETDTFTTRDAACLPDWLTAHPLLAACSAPVSFFFQNYILGHCLACPGTTITNPPKIRNFPQPHRHACYVFYRYRGGTHRRQQFQQNVSPNVELPSFCYFKIPTYVWEKDKMAANVCGGTKIGRHLVLVGRQAGRPARQGVGWKIAQTVLNFNRGINWLRKGLICCW